MVNPLIQVDLFLVTIGGMMVEEMPYTGNRRRFINYCISMLHPSEMIRDKYPAGFTIDSLIYILPVAFIKGHPR